MQSGNRLVSHPAAPGAIPSILPQKSDEKLSMLLRLTALARGKWTTGHWHENVDRTLLVLARTHKKIVPGSKSASNSFFQLESDTKMVLDQLQKDSSDIMNLIKKEKNERERDSNVIKERIDNERKELQVGKRPEPDRIKNWH